MQEIVSKRKWDAKKFDTGKVLIDDKGVKHTVYASKIQNGLHDIEPDGSFVEVNRLSMPYEVGVSTDKIIRNRAGEVRYSDTASTSKQLAKIKTKRLKGISLKLMGYTTYGPMWPTLKEARYTTYDGIEVSQVANYKGFNLTLEIANPQIAQNVYRFSSKNYDCNYIYEEINGNIHCKSPDGKDDIWIRCFPAIDSEGNEGNVILRLGGLTAEGYQIIEKVIDPVWLGNAIGLVKVDPSVTIEDGVSGGVIEDNFMIENNTTSNQGAATTLNIKSLIVGFARAILAYVNLSPYSTTTPIAGKFLCTTTTAGAFNCKAFALKKKFIESESTWDIYSTGNNWETGGAKGSTDRESTEECIFTTGSSIGAVVEVPITVDTLTGWLTDNKGVVMEHITDLDGSWICGSAEHSTDPIQFYYEYTEGGGTGSLSLSTSIFDKHYGAFKELANKNTIV